MIHEAYKESFIIWQELDTDSGLPEPALLIERYNDIVSIQQGKEYINLNYDSIPELIKLLRKIHKEHKEE
jgi:hypothetical protein